MNCFDCATSLHPAPGASDRAAVGVCSLCGAGLCADHARVGLVRIETHSVGNPGVSHVPGRRLLCESCDPMPSASLVTGPSEAVPAKVH